MAPKNCKTAADDEENGVHGCKVDKKFAKDGSETDNQIKECYVPLTDLMSLFSGNLDALKMLNEKKKLSRCVYLPKNKKKSKNDCRKSAIGSLSSSTAELIPSIQESGDPDGNSRDSIQEASLNKNNDFGNDKGNEKESNALHNKVETELSDCLNDFNCFPSFTKHRGALSTWDDNTTRLDKCRKRPFGGKTDLLQCSEEPGVKKTPPHEPDQDQNDRVGVWVQCSYEDCQKWRYLCDILDPLEVPSVWYCRMNPDIRYNDCNKAESPYFSENELMDNAYTAGSVVWGKVSGYPWWPAMIDDDPEISCFYWPCIGSTRPEFYHVTFFDSSSVTRCWIIGNNLRRYERVNPYEHIKTVPWKYKNRLVKAVIDANVALDLSIADRLNTYSFVRRYRGIIIPYKYGFQGLDSLKPACRFKSARFFSHFDGLLDDALVVSLDGWVVSCKAMSMDSLLNFI